MGAGRPGLPRLFLIGIAGTHPRLCDAVAGPPPSPGPRNRLAVTVRLLPGTKFAGTARPSVRRACATGRGPSRSRQRAVRRAVGPLPVFLPAAAVDPSFAFRRFEAGADHLPAKTIALAGPVPRRFAGYTPPHGPTPPPPRRRAHRPCPWGPRNLGPEAPPDLDVPSNMPRPDARHRSSSRSLDPGTGRGPTSARLPAAEQRRIAPGLGGAVVRQDRGAGRRFALVDRRAAGRIRSGTSRSRPVSSATVNAYDDLAGRFSRGVPGGPACAPWKTAAAVHRAGPNEPTGRPKRSAPGPGRAGGRTRVEAAGRAARSGGVFAGRGKGVARPLFPGTRRTAAVSGVTTPRLGALNWHGDSAAEAGHRARQCPPVKAPHRARAAAPVNLFGPPWVMSAPPRWAMVGCRRKPLAGGFRGVGAGQGAAEGRQLSG